jgi:hypothetical protein
MVQGQRINQLLEAESASTSTLSHCSPQILVVAADLALLFLQQKTSLVRNQCCCCVSHEEETGCACMAKQTKDLPSLDAAGSDFTQGISTIGNTHAWSESSTIHGGKKKTRVKYTPNIESPVPNLTLMNVEKLL